MKYRKISSKLSAINVSALGIILIILGCAELNRKKKPFKDAAFVNINDSNNLSADFKEPPSSAKPWAYWWWLEGNIDEEGILHDLTAMKEVGIAGAVVFDAGSSSYSSVTRTESGPGFMSDRWQELYAKAVQVADSLGITMSMNTTSGWNDGGPWVTPEFASKKITWSASSVKGPGKVKEKLPMPDNLLTYKGDTEPFFYPIAAFALRKTYEHIPSVDNIDLKSVRTILPAISGAPPDWETYLRDSLYGDNRFHARLKEIIDLSGKVSEKGILEWEVPEGEFDILWFGYTGTGVKVSTASPGGEGLAIDYMNEDAMDLQFEHTAGTLLKDLTSYAGRTFNYLHDDSWELGAANWTPSFTEEFRKVYGYDPLPFLPVVAGKIVEDREISNRFLYDLRKMIGDLIARNHYERFSQLARNHNMGIHPESGGPHPAPIDALKNLGHNDIPMGEFWARAETHRVEDHRRIYIKQSASAAHIYGKKIVQAEGPTTIGPHWEVDPWHLKPTIDRVFAEGMNRLVFHTFTHSPKSAGKPGNEYFAGTHFNSNITWWEQAPAFLDYISRTQLLLQQGLFVGDVIFYYGDNVPNQVPLKRINPELGEGYDYDVTNTEVILTRMSVRNNRIYLPDGMSYAVLVLPDRDAIPIEVLKKLEQLVKDGATVIGPKPSSIPGLKDYKEADVQIKEIAGDMWGSIDGKEVKENNYGKGKVVCGKTIREVLLEKGIEPDFIYESSKNNAFIDYIHRSSEKADIYFLANRNEQPEHLKVSFRLKNKVPELWYPENGEIVKQSIYSTENGRITMPLQLDPFGSVFVVFRDPSSVSDTNFTAVSLNGQNMFPSGIKKFHILPQPLKNKKLVFYSPGKYQFRNSQDKVSEINIDAISSKQQLEGSWIVNFEAGWGGPDSVEFNSLKSWTEHDMEGIKYYSGSASYHKSFELSPKKSEGEYQILLNLGVVHNLAEVIINDKNLGVLWKKPFEIDITEQVKTGENSLTVKVVNLWPNRIIGDQFLPEEKRYTQTNVTKFTKEYPLLKSGLLGPVSLSFYPVREIN